MRTTPLLAGLLLLAALAGCIGGEDPGPSLGTYTVQEAADDATGGSGGEHAGHGGGGGGFQEAAEVFHFNASHTASFEYHEVPLGAHVTWALEGGQATIILQDASGATVFEKVVSAKGEVKQLVEGEHGTWTLNVTGQDATGTLSYAFGDAAAMGLVQDEPITYQDTLAGSSDSQTWTWATKGTATLTLQARAVTGTLTIKALDGQAQPIDPVSLTGPGQVQDTFTLEGAPGEWTITLQTDTYSGDVAMEIAGAE